MRCAEIFARSKHPREQVCGGIEVRTRAGRDVGDGLLRSGDTLGSDTSKRDAVANGRPDVAKCNDVAHHEANAECGNGGACLIGEVVPVALGLLHHLVGALLDRGEAPFRLPLALLKAALKIAGVRFEQKQKPLLIRRH